ncbi:hypothetical protein ACQVPW_23590 [Bacillus cereus]|uniref:hypothetical protein n=1 Tax=Bacillus TaxID=1386 RepID=UPI00086E43EB|nr:hypothetical protein [Bacillus cereus]PFW60675.1 hypothetical protein COL27_30855 [Bacillus sp. AFS075960]RFB42007.1 hypothetical protein DZB83_28045 [Bacillus sp. dmp10]HDR8173782.1 hypothetical protein [Bacillus thuringiensis]PEW42156.1 hypothetical protein CN431_14090 [Bacillus cereus]
MGLGKRGNEVDQQQGESSLFSEIRNTGHVSNIRVKQIDKAIQYVLNNDEAVVNKILPYKYGRIILKTGNCFIHAIVCFLIFSQCNK